jgi:hypothetical protein
MNPRETLTGGEVAAALHLSDRQVRRLRRRFKTEGAEGLLHCSRGRPSPRRLARRLRQRIAALLFRRLNPMQKFIALTMLPTSLGSLPHRMQQR